MSALCNRLIDSPFWGRGFRPFFFLGSLYAALSILLWSGVYTGHIAQPSALADPVSWHAHEMIYGFGLAIVAGFLLTAVANWTGGAPVRQLHLLGLSALWVAGRVVMNVDVFPGWVVVAVELLFLPALAISLSLPLIKSWNTRNFIFLALLAALYACDITFFLMQDRLPLYTALFLILMMISLIGGRIIPAFTVAALRRKGLNVSIHDQPLMDKVALLSLAAVTIALWLGGMGSGWFALAAFASALAHLGRMRHYHTHLTFSDPMVWILHAGYGWLVVGLFLAGLSVFGIGLFPAALHALTVGAIGSMTLGMMCRVTLGHTGRNLSSSALTTLSFVLMQLAAILRAFGPVLFPEHYVVWVISSGVVWSVCFLLYFLIYAPMLLSSRPDKQPA